ncbi:unnamed protein product [Vitrella brassicaformis CCMP3155]|uniref:Thioredoxin domain-containing protein n=1 Tax=Vitrella brassicaformis (strain CCMP3155) TaxID=1169540 RepID=A0A0G4GA08_VITBC|nr:unnamed protein product [Vitrella brassicaformis CCMP3155]|eukprot:CEM25780.1 unnamed protein product [Vitrella brassicaformis CCMP3155]
MRRRSVRMSAAAEVEQTNRVRPLQGLEEVQAAIEKDSGVNVISVVFIQAKWCKNCAATRPVLEGLAKECAEAKTPVSFYSIDFDESKTAMTDIAPTLSRLPWCLLYAAGSVTASESFACGESKVYGVLKPLIDLYSGQKAGGRGGGESVEVGVTLKQEQESEQELMEALNEVSSPAVTKMFNDLYKPQPGKRIIGGLLLDTPKDELEKLPDPSELEALRKKAASDLINIGADERRRRAIAGAASALATLAIGFACVKTGASPLARFGAVIVPTFFTVGFSLSAKEGL